MSDDEVVDLERKQTFSGRYKAIPQMLRGRNAMFDDIAQNAVSYHTIFLMGLVAFGSLALFGLFMGTYNFDFIYIQPFVGALKRPFVFLVSLAVCLPALYITSVYLGMNLYFRQILALFMVAITVTAVTAGCLAPLCLFFQTIIGGGDRYHWLLVINVSLLGISGMIGLFYLRQGIGFLVRRRTRETGRIVRARSVLNLWILVYMIVTVMLTWQLRPYMCREDISEWERVRPRGQHFLAAVSTHVAKLAHWVASDETITKEAYYELIGVIEQKEEALKSMKRELSLLHLMTIPNKHDAIRKLESERVVLNTQCTRLAELESLAEPDAEARIEASELRAKLADKPNDRALQYVISEDQQELAELQKQFTRKDHAIGEFQEFIKSHEETLKWHKENFLRRDGRPITE